MPRYPGQPLWQQQQVAAAAAESAASGSGILLAPTAAAAERWLHAFRWLVLRRHRLLRRSRPPHRTALRQFRDDVLMRLAPGRGFINWYYRRGLGLHACSTVGRL